MKLAQHLKNEIAPWSEYLLEGKRLDIVPKVVFYNGSMYGDQKPFSMLEALPGESF